MIRLFRLPIVLSVLAPLALTVGAPSPAGAGGEANYSVDTTSNVSLAGCDGATLEDCSLRGAIDKSNANGGSVDTITFNIPMSDGGCNAGTGVCTITPATPGGTLDNLPTITDPVVINGLSQPGASAGNLKLQLSGPANPANTRGLFITAGATTVIGLVVNHFEEGIHFSATGGNNLESNYVGTDPTGTSDEGNGAGVIINNAGDNTIGGSVAGEGNVISGNNVGINVSVSANDLIVGNRIGTNAAGTEAVPNGNGIRLSGATNTQIGGTTAAERNVISGNANQGIHGDGGTNIEVQGNYIGVASDGTTALGNGGSGIFDNVGTTFTIGGTAPGAGNVIAFNGGNGAIVLPFANTIPILGNRIFSNTGLGIDLAPLGVQPNDPGDADAGPNALQNHPVIAGFFPGAGATTIEGALNSTASTSFRIEFFYSNDCDPSGFGEGQFFIGTSEQATDAGGDVNFSVSLPMAVPQGAAVTATATDPAGNTSEFSHCFLDPVKGDVDCSSAINAVDSLKLLRFSAGLSVGQTEPCPDVGQQINAIPEEMGDINCNDDENSVDSLLVLRHNAGLPVNLPQGCRVIGTIHGTVITATDFAWTPGTFSAAKGRLVGFAVQNNGGVPHALRIDGGDGTLPSGDDVLAFPAITSTGQKSAVAWQTPDQLGPVQFRCDIHPAMTGTIDLK